MDTYHDGGNNSELDAQKETFKNRLSEAIGRLCGCWIRRPAGCWVAAAWRGQWKKHEDAALKHFGLEDVEGILRNLEDKASQFAVIDQVIAQANEASDVFVPPDSAPVPKATGSGTGMEKKGKQPKLENLLFVLMNDFGIDPDDPEAVSIVRGRCQYEYDARRAVLSSYRAWNW